MHGATLFAEMTARLYYLLDRNRSGIEVQLHHWNWDPTCAKEVVRIVTDVYWTAHVKAVWFAALFGGTSVMFAVGLASDLMSCDCA